ncbi:MAG: hypothetical protein IJR47_02465 [Clostridia bacterium]|nr:hypothetical protein [Clostridia bacterium]
MQAFKKVDAALKIKKRCRLLCVFFENFKLVRTYNLHTTFLFLKGGAKVKKIASFILAAALVCGILYLVKADVNHGHGPGHDGEGEHGEVTTEHH